MSTQHETASDGNVLTENTFTFLQAAGASGEFLEFLRHDNESSIRRSVQSDLRHGALSGDPTEYAPLGGHFFDNLWEGDLFGAWRRADPANRRIMRDVFGESTVIAAAVTGGLNRETAAQFVSN
ncbi:hypothetical protein [Halonotius roseus]|uniref:Uncharacterized protein n=1 Tax=Halonotius roseus TaxID=2511997 RepID=A0A544QR11_9EURY|nr:hypothetical protein [Halonotius roseus]TQQ81879.1 hypothetical protein EWF95_02775 [Halonotius roseus]